MPITIKGIRITSLSVTKDEEGTDVIAANYQLVSSADKVLAKESLTSKNRYSSDEIFTPSPQTIKAIADAVTLYKKDVEMTLGLEAA